MITKTKKNNLGTNHYFSIPKNIQEKINERGFALYNWIGEHDVKQSIERDFLKLIKKLGTFFSVILIIPSTILLYIKAYSLFNLYFFGVLGIINIFLIIYLIILAIKRSSILRKNSQILITDSSISINGKIKKLENNKIISNYNLFNIGNLFEEKLFGNSNIHKTKKGLKKQVLKQITNGYSKIFEIKVSKDIASEIVMRIIIALLYNLYVLSLGVIYIFGIFFIWIFGNILTYINKQILLYAGHEITTINNYFENIDKNSKELVKEKNKLSTLLKDAMKNDWKDSLLTKINSGISNINNNASSSVNTSIELKKTIEKSKYKKMFNFSIYNSWIKKQILTPLEQIKDLLNTNLLKLKETLKQITNQIKETKDNSLSGSLTANKLRIEKKIIDIENHIKAMDIYINKLK